MHRAYCKASGPGAAVRSMSHETVGSSQPELRLLSPVGGRLHHGASALRSFSLIPTVATTRLVSTGFMMWKWASLLPTQYIYLGPQQSDSLMSFIRSY